MPIGTSLSPNVASSVDGDAVVADRGGDEPAGEGVAVDGGDGGARIGEQAHVRRPVVGEPRPDGGRVAGEQPEVLIEVKAGGEAAAGPGQHDRGVGVIAFEPVERVVEVGEEGPVLRVDGVGRHRHHGHAPAALDYPAHVDVPLGPARRIISRQGRVPLEHGDPGPAAAVTALPPDGSPAPGPPAATTRGRARADWPGHRWRPARSTGGRLRGCRTRPSRAILRR